VIELVKNSNMFGIHIENISVNHEEIFQRTNNFTKSQSSKLLNMLQNQKNPTFFHGECRFVKEKTLQIKDKRISAKKIIIVCGSRPIIPKIERLEKFEFFTNEGTITLGRMPKSMTIIGGGYIGCEFAHFLEH